MLFFSFFPTFFTFLNTNIFTVFWKFSFLLFYDIVTLFQKYVKWALKMTKKWPKKR